MRTCPTTKEKFEPKNADHFFTSVDAFEKFIDSVDPLKEFKPQKREINWTPQVRFDPNTGEKFLAEHPAQIFAPKKDEDKDPSEVYEAQEKECAKCHRKFLRVKPAQKYCEECSDKGGELLEQ